MFQSRVSLLLTVKAIPLYTLLLNSFNRHDVLALGEFGALSSRNLAGQLPRDLAKSLGQAAVVQAYDDAIAMLKAKEEATLLQQGDLGQLLLGYRRLLMAPRDKIGGTKRAEISRVRESAAVQARTFETQLTQQAQEISRLGQLTKTLSERTGNAKQDWLSKRVCFKIILTNKN